MNPNKSRLTDVSHRISHNNLHIKCKSFEEEEANLVMGLVKQFQGECERIFIDVRDISKAQSGVAQGFKHDMGSLKIQPQRVVFKGAEGFDLAINGNRILVAKNNKEQAAVKPKKHVCCGKCAHCHCHDHE
ncbi:MAG: squalene cyclase [Desulfovibrio sp.]|nr:squalene cyclase [Desulfovibrio sp.]